MARAHCIKIGFSYFLFRLLHLTVVWIWIAGCLKRVLPSWFVSLLWFGEGCARFNYQCHFRQQHSLIFALLFCLSRPRQGPSGIKLVFRLNFSGIFRSGRFHINSFAERSITETISCPLIRLRREITKYKQIITFVVSRPNAKWNSSPARSIPVGWSVVCLNSLLFRE